MGTPEIEAVIAERKKQDEKWGVQNHGPDGWLAILIEEVGEVAKAILEGSALKYCDELTQVAAVAVAALECANRGSLEIGSLVKAQQELKKAIRDRDELWCKSLIHELDTTGIAAVTRFFNRIRPDAAEEPNEARKTF
jgi:NTP pyrophosphatase (non-canonical NTP hydrolase)